jgi:hypothetical protein
MLAIASLILLFAHGASAEGKGKGAKGGKSDRVPVNVMVVHTSDGEGGVDPRARDLDRKLKKQLRYKSMRVIREERVDLRVDEVGTVRLPDGRAVRMRPMHKGKKGVLMAVDVEGSVKLDARAPNHHKVVIGAGEYEDGNLAISIEPDYEE